MELAKHYEHSLELVKYANPETGEVHNYAIECFDCYEVIVDEEVEEN